MFGSNHLLFRDFELYVIIFTNVCVVITVAMVTLFRDFEIWHIFMTVYSLLYTSPVILDGQFIICYIINDKFIKFFKLAIC